MTRFGVQERKQHCRVTPAKEYYHPPLDEMLFHHRVPSILLGLPKSYWYPFIQLGGERQCRVKFLPQLNNMTVETRLNLPTFRSKVQRADH